MPPIFTRNPTYVCNGLGRTLAYISGGPGFDSWSDPEFFCYLIQLGGQCDLKWWTGKCGLVCLKFRFPTCMTVGKLKNNGEGM